MGYENDLANLGLISGGAQGFIKGMQDAENNKYRKMEFDSKMQIQEEQRKRDALEQAIKLRSSGLMQGPDGQLSEDPAQTKRADIMKLAGSHQRPVYGESGELTGAELDPAYAQFGLERAQAQAMFDPYGAKSAQAQNAKLETSKKLKDAAQEAKGFKLAPDKVLQVQQGAQIPKMLQDVRATLESNKKLFGPAMGRLGSMNPYDTTSQTVNAQMSTAAQSIGRYMEGGVLRKEDEEKYRKMLPTLTDTPEVAANKLDLVEKMLSDKQNADVGALKSQGYDTQGFSQLPEGKLPKGLVKQGLTKKASSAPAPEKAKTVIQNGHTYTLNPKTGEYE